MVSFTDTQIQEILNQRATRENGIHDIVKMACNAVMYGERHTYLQRGKTLHNKANGYRSIKVNGYGRQLALAVPRDRLGAFQPLLLKALQEQEQEVHRLCYELCEAGFSVRKLAKILEKVYGKRYSSSNVSRIVQMFKKGLAQGDQDV